MNDQRKSDGSIISEKPSNKDGQPRESDHGDPYTGTKAETPDTAKGDPTVRTRTGQPTAEGVEKRDPTKGNSAKQNRSRAQIRIDLQRALDRIREVAKRDREMQFTTLWHHVYNIDRLREAYLSLKRNAASGVDDVTWQSYGEDLEANLQVLSEQLERGAYRARPVKRVLIPKADGRQRPIGITTLEDKVVQRATVEVLNAVYEVDFLGFSYGFRPGRGPHDALDAVSVGITTRKVSWVLDADIRGFFDAIDRGWLEQFIEHRIADKRVLRHVKKWLNAGVVEEGEWKQVTKGTVQGGSISPLLANVYLHYVFDLWAHQWRRRHARGDVILVRYADDVIVGFQHRDDADRFMADLTERFRQFSLELHPDKTRLIEFGRFATERRRKRGEGKPETFDFLGFTHICARNRTRSFMVRRKTKRKSLQRKLKELKEELRHRMHWPIPVVGKWLRAVLQGHYNYYGVPYNYPSLKSFRYAVVGLWLKTLRRRSQRSNMTWQRYRRLVEHWIPNPRIVHPWPLQRLHVNTRGRSPVR